MLRLFFPLPTISDFDVASQIGQCELPPRLSMSERPSSVENVHPTPLGICTCLEIFCASSPRSILSQHVRPIRIGEAEFLP